MKVNSILLTNVVHVIMICLVEYFRLYLPNFISPVGGAVEYTECISAEEYDPSPMSVLDMTLNNLMVRLQ